MFKSYFKFIRNILLEGGGGKKINETRKLPPINYPKSRKVWIGTPFLPFDYFTIYHCSSKSINSIQFVLTKKKKKRKNEYSRSRRAESKVILLI